MNAKKSQSILDFIIAFIAIAALAVGIVRIWVWFNANYAKRQVGYQQSRLLAAGRNRPITDYNTPTGIGADDANREQGFQPIDLTEDWVFKGEASGTVGGGPVPFIVSAGLDCASLVDAYTQQIISICGTDEDCNNCPTDCATGGTGTGGGTGGGCPGCLQWRLYGAVPQAVCSKCDSYDTCESKVASSASIYCADPGTCPCPGSGTDSGGSTGETDCGQACSLRETAQTMRNTADKLTENWLLKLFGGKGGAKKLRKSADDIDDEAEKLEGTANQVIPKVAALSDCCSQTTPELQNECISRLQKEISDLWRSLSGVLEPEPLEPPVACPEGEAYLCYNENTQSLCAEGDEGCTCKCRSGTVPGCSYEYHDNAWVWVCQTCTGCTKWTYGGQTVSECKCHTAEKCKSDGHVAHSATLICAEPGGTCPCP